MGQPGLEPGTSVLSGLRSNPDLLKRYLAWLALQGLSQRYITCINELLAKFVTSVTTIAPETARDFFAQYAHRRPATRAVYAAYLRGFLDFLGMEFGAKVKRTHPLPPLVREEDVHTLIEAMRCKATHKGKLFRDMILVETASNTGLRRGELANLRPRDVDFEASRLTVRVGKGAKDRVIPLQRGLTSKLSSLCRGKAPDEPIFGLSGKGISSKFYVWAKKAGVDLHAHSFRHYFATTLVERGANIRAVQELLGHASLNTTQVYVAVTGRHLEDAIQLLD